VIFGVLTVFLALRYYHRYQRKRNETKLKLFEHEKEKEVYQAKIEFFTHMAHEIQTPLTLISVPVGRVLSKAEDYPAISKSLSTIGKYTNQLIELTSRLLDFRQTEMEQYGLNFVNADISSLLRDLLDSFTELAQEYQISIKSSFPEEYIVAFVDREAFYKISSNLMTNAIKYAASSVFVTLAPSGEDTFTISIANDGKAIPEEYHEKIFEPFFRVKTSAKPGTGIGLSLARSLTELHKGTLVLASGAADRIVFKLTLPRHQQFEFNLGTWKKIG
jgi:signal transduction histidine kinase